MKKMLVKNTAVLLSVITACAAMPCVGASAAESDIFPYAMFAASSAEGAITVNANWTTINGSIASNGTIAVGGHANFNGAKTENAGKDMLFIGDKITDKYFSTAKEVDTLDFAGVNVSVNTPFEVKGSAKIDGNANINASIKAEDDITISGNVNNTSNSVIYSEFGDVVMDSTNVNLSGMIYAPLGNVEINAQSINLNNVVIIADTITLNSNCINANYGKSYAQFAGTQSESRAAYITKYNSKLMDDSIDASLDLISQYYNVTPIETGDFGHINVMGMIDFNITQYNVEGLGNLCMMRAEGMTQMTTFVLTPYDKDLPLLAFDYMYNGDQRISYFETYDLTADKNTDEYQNVLSNLSVMFDRYKGLEDSPAAEDWYDDLRTVALFKKSDFRSDDVTNQLMMDAYKIMLDSSVECHQLSEEEKAAKHVVIQQYADDLVDKGGTATNLFKATIGADATKQFFNQVFYGTALN